MLAPGLTAAVLTHLPAVLADDSTTTKKNGSPVVTIVLLAAIVVGIFFVVTRGRRAKAAQAQAQDTGLVIGATVLTRGGLLATLVDRTDDELVLELAPGVRARFVPQAILRVVADDTDDTGDTGGDVPADPDDGTADRHAGGSADARDDRLAD